MKDFRDYIIKRETEITGIKPSATDLIRISDANHYFNSYQAEQLIIPDVIVTLLCDVEKGTKCKDPFPKYRTGVCRNCGGQSN